MFGLPLLMVLVIPSLGLNQRVNSLLGLAALDQEAHANAANAFASRPLSNELSPTISRRMPNPTIVQ